VQGKGFTNKGQGTRKEFAYAAKTNMGTKQVVVKGEEANHVSLVSITTK